ncbi:MAG: MAPEG family protein [Sandaracinobacteroides sp.]
MKITMITSGILGLLLLVLGIRVVLARMKDSISLGDGGNPELLKRVRAHGNSAEWVPIGLILLFLAEQGFGGTWFVLALAAMLVAGRVLHPFGLRPGPPNPARSLGMVFTWTSIGLLAILVLVHAIAG